MSNFDPCECVWNHESAMQRLISLLRNSQNTCSDSGCLTDEMPGPNSPDGGYSTMMMMMMIGWLVVATALFLLRPPSLRDCGDNKPSSSGRGNDPNNPPPPGPSVH